MNRKPAYKKRQLKNLNEPKKVNVQQKIREIRVKIGVTIEEPSEDNKFILEI